MGILYSCDNNGIIKTDPKPVKPVNIAKDLSA